MTGAVHRRGDPADDQGEELAHPRLQRGPLLHLPPASHHLQCRVSQKRAFMRLLLLLGTDMLGSSWFCGSSVILMRLRFRGESVPAHSRQDEVEQAGFGLVFSSGPRPSCPSSHKCLGPAHTCMSYAFSIPLPFPGKHGCFSGRSRIPWIASCNSWLEILVCFFTSETVKKKGFCVLLVLLMFVVVERLYNRTGLGLQHHFFFSNVQHHFIGQ